MNWTDPEEVKEYQKKYREEHKKEAKKYHQEHKEEKRKYYKKYAKRYYQEHKENRKKYLKKYRKENKEKINKYAINRRKIDINFRILHSLRTRLNVIIKNNLKSQSTKKLLGCSITELKQHLESQFKKGMNWNNYGTGWYGKGKEKWHIDHIKPCYSFDLSKEEAQKQCFHYTNLRPLWAKENWERPKEKRRKITWRNILALKN